ncbi:hypothetical protein DFH09DRAFT_821060, partial [Mycena vulgaris]
DLDDRRPPFFLKFTEVKLLGIAGVGFFLDAYDFFVINVRYQRPVAQSQFTQEYVLPVATILQDRLYGDNDLPAGLQGLVKA